MKRLLLLVGAASIVCAVAAEDPVKTSFIGFHLTPGLSGSDEPILIVDAIVPNSPASKAGLRRGDMIHSVNGIPVSATDEFTRATRGAKPNEVLTFVVQRSKNPKAIAVTVQELTPERTAKLATLKPGNLKSLGIPEIAYIPHRFCYTGVSFGEALLLSMEPGSINMPLSELQQCRSVAESCAPLGLSQQSKYSTVVKRGGRTYRLQGDWTRLTFRDQAECQQAQRRAPETAEAHPSAP